jgi:glycogen operon protein
MPDAPVDDTPDTPVDDNVWTMPALSITLMKQV